jgi:hypothetical protein
MGKTEKVGKNLPLSQEGDWNSMNYSGRPFDRQAGYSSIHVIATTKITGLRVVWRKLDKSDNNLKSMGN